MSRTATRLDEFVTAFGETQVNRPTVPGKWSPREIVTHLADCEIAHGWRYRQALAEDNPTVQPWNQDLWARNYSAYDVQQALRTFTAFREWNLALVRSLSSEQLARPMRHPERGELTVCELIEIAAGHDINHLQQLEAALKRKR